MSDSATNSPGLREQRKNRTRRDLCHRARQLTIERGLSGFTIEELCADVGVSRRTFFNYYAGKEAAVVGHDADAVDEDALAAFTRGDDGAPTLLDGLAELAITTMTRWDDEHDAVDPHALIEREPHLLTHMIGAGRQLEQRIVTAIETREGLAAGDPLARTAAVVIGSLVNAAGHRVFAEDDGGREEFAEILRASVAATRAAGTPNPATSARPIGTTESPS
ncbi:AcrR family transcriptional regulator [Agromyces terreus]|uniref:AcrR family transcriptional regulator n=1 Tax=Agromyces terreus TaxID=424795 RepID=A0A9X2GZD6_9MICO|nr:TetR/AcrR family transcriptional regulator [Agromyces terreus]MCP2369905.1 AcrR family transcriptional regulator [Agromyces terreus]